MIKEIRPTVDKNSIFNGMAKTSKNMPNTIMASSFAQPVVPRYGDRHTSHDRLRRLPAQQVRRLTFPWVINDEDNCRHA
jgi:hypothetical protein